MKMGNKLYIAGIGPGARELVHPAAGRLIEGCDILIGGRRNLELFPEVCSQKVEIGNNLEEIRTLIEQNIADKKIVVLVTGDPGIYSIMDFLKSRLEEVEIEALPGISSLQYLCSKLRLSWNDAYITSFHGRRQNDFISIVRKNKKVVVFTGGTCRPENVCKMLVEGDLTHITVTVGENLSYPDERIVRGTPEDVSAMSFGNLSLMVIENDNADGRLSGVWGYETPGIPDDMFIRAEVPMTKEEVRVVSLAKLRLREDSIVYDIGAGTGSISIECALRSRGGRVYAVERNNLAVSLLQKNKERFNAGNIFVIEGEAPSVLTGLPEPDRVFIGGTGGSMREILNWIKEFGKEVRVVINTITVESTYEALTDLEKSGFEDIEVVNVAVSRGKKTGAKHLMQALNPVYVISAEKKLMEDKQCQVNYMVWE